MLTTLVGLVVGVLTGYYFEWRSSRETRRHNAQLQEELRVLRESIYATGRVEHLPRQQSRAESVIDDEVGQWILSHQGPDGTILRGRVIQRFLEAGFTSDEINAALQQLDERGIIASGHMIEVR